MDLKTNTVVDLQLVQVSGTNESLPVSCFKLKYYLNMALFFFLWQSNEVGGSSHMEKEGLKRSLTLLGARGITPNCIVTDRHPQIQKFLRENNITQFYDVWQMEKGTLT